MKNADTTDYHDERRVLIALLKQRNDGPVVLGPMTAHQRLTTTVTCTASVLMHHLAAIANFNVAKASEGLDILIADMRKNMARICAHGKPVDENIHALIASCERCGGRWSLLSTSPPEHLEGICMECQADSDTEKPLTFRKHLTHDFVYDPLPPHWLAGGDE